MSDRILNAELAAKVMSADEAAQFINNGDTVGTSGFTGAGYPKALPAAIAKKAKAAHEAGDEFKINLFTGASTADDADGVLAEANAINFRAPYNSDRTLRGQFNKGEAFYSDIHLSHVGHQVYQGFFGDMQVAILECTKINEDGSIVPSSAVGNNVEYAQKADKIILEVNSWQSLDLEGMHDIYVPEQLWDRVPININHPGDRIGETVHRIDTSKVVAVVETNTEDRNAPFKEPDDVSKQIAANFLQFLEDEVKAGRLSYDNYIMQSGVGNVANAVMSGLLDSKFEGITAYTEVIQDGMLDLIDAGKMTVASASSFSLSPEAAKRMNDRADFYRKHIILRPQALSNSPEVIRRLGLIATNGLIEVDLFGNVNSTNISGSKVMNGIGGSGDFTRNAYISSFVTPSVAKDGAISAIVPFASHIDHTEHDVMIVVSEYGYADLRGLAPRQRAQRLIDIAHPDYRPLLEEYVERGLANGGHTPVDLATAFDFHVRLAETGTMKK